MLKNYYNLIAISICFIAFLNANAQGSNPEPYLLNLADYSFTEWDPESPAGSFPISTVIHRSTGNDPTLTNFTAAVDYTNAYNLTSGTRVTGEGENGISFVNTGTNGNLGAFLVALNTLGRGNILVSFTCGLITQGNGDPTPREYRMRLQYRIGQSGTWNSFSSPIEYSSAGNSNGHSQNFENIELPAECNDQAVVQVRWLYYQHNNDGTGTRPRIRLDDISITSESFVCEAPVQPSSAIAASNISATAATLSWINGDGINRIVLIRAGQAIEEFPVNGTSYPANSAFGTAGTELADAYVVFNGSGNSVDLTNLELGVIYHVAIFEYSCNGILYLTSDFPVFNFQTVAAPAMLIQPSNNITFATNAAIPSVPVVRTVSGTTLSSDITITSSEFFEISLAIDGPYTQELTLTPVDGTVSSTEVFIRFSPAGSENQTGTLTLTSEGLADIVINLTGNIVVSGSLPATFALCQGNYLFDNWPASSPAGTYPENMVFHRMSQNDPPLTAIDASDYIDVYDATSQTRINGLGAEGFSMINTGTNGNLGAAVLGLNTLGRNNISVSFLASMMTQGAGNPTPRDYGLRLQYRVGSDSWTDFSEPVEYVTTGLTNGNIQNFTDIVLPEACNNQPAVYLRWFYYQIAANSGGSRPRIRVDNIGVTSTSSLPALSDAISVNESEAETIDAMSTGTIQDTEDGVQVWEFAIRDGGESGDIDNFPTLITDIVVLKGEDDNTQSWLNNIGNAAIFEGETKVADGTVTANSIQFSGVDLSVADNSAITLALRISMAEDGAVEDGATLQFKLDESSFSLGDPCNSSRFAAFSIESDADRNLIDVSASQLNFTNITMTIVNNVAFSVAVSASDENGNIDSAVRQVTLSATPALGNGLISSVSGLGPREMQNGTFTWNDLIIDLQGNYTLTAESNDMPALTADVEIQVADGTNIFSPEASLPLLIFPNPNTERMLHFTESIDGFITDLSGRKIMEFKESKALDVKALPEGIYYIMSNKGFGKVILR